MEEQKEDVRGSQLGIRAGPPRGQRGPLPKEPTSENLQAQFKYNTASSEIGRRWVSTKTCQCPTYFQLFKLQGVEIIEKFYGILFKYKIWIVHTKLWNYRGVLEERNIWFKINQLAYILGEAPPPNFQLY